MSPSKFCDPFDSYVAPARVRPAFWRLCVGVSLIIAVYLGMLIPLFGLISVSFSTEAAFDDFMAGETRFGAAVLLASFGLITLGIWIVVNLLHKRSLASVIGPLSPALRNFAVSALVYIALALVSLAIWSIWFDGVPRNSLASVALWFPLIAVLVLIQTSAEEFLFRGYLVQQLAARFRATWVWFVLPQFIFAFLHFDPDLNGDLNWIVVALIFGYALMWTDLIRLTGNIGAACGWHFANNLFLFTLIGQPGNLDAFSLMVTPYTAMDTPYLLIVGDVFLAILTWQVLRRILRP